MNRKAFSLLELSIVLLIVGIISLLGLNSKSLFIKANCLVSNFGSKTVTKNLDNLSALTKDKSTAYENCVTSGGSGQAATCPNNTCSSCKTTLAANPESLSGTYTIDPDGAGSDAPFSVYCDMTTDGGGWTLVGITNSYTIINSVDNAFNVNDDYTGSYVKRLTGLSGTDSMFDCGTSNQGVKGAIILTNGSWNWPNNGTLQISSNFTVKSSNLTWNPDLPGYESVNSQGMWHNHVSSGHYPNMGSQSFISAIANNGDTFNNSFFSCDPLNNAYGGGYATWFSGATGTRYVRYWLR